MRAGTSSSTWVGHKRWGIALQCVAALVGVEVALHSFIVKEPMLTLIVAALWLAAGVVWTRRGGRGGPIAVAGLSVFEIVVSVLFTEEVSAPGVAPWIIVVHLVLVSAALVAAGMVIVGGRASARAA